VIRRLILSSSLALMALFGCHSGPKSAAADASNVTVYHLHGTVVSTDAPHGIVVLDHDAIPGFMGAMTMPYQLKDPTIVSELHPGDTITADVLVSKDSAETVVLDHIVVVAQARPDYKPPVVYHVPTPGDKVPDFALRNQDGRAIHLGQFKGQTLLLTFIYTRCPLPNFCPLVTRHFATIHSELATNPALYSKTHLLCVSFDPKNDTPERLRAYGATYIGSDDKKAFERWDFAVPTEPALLEMAKFFDVGITHGADDSITHTLSTTLIGSDGKVAHFYPGNEWTPEQVLGDVKKLAGNAG
jgi:protein SCO1/2